MSKLNVTSAAKFALFPFHRAELLGGWQQRMLIIAILHQNYQRLGLIPTNLECTSVTATLRAAWRGWLARWGAGLTAGWQLGRNYGFDGRIGGFAKAFAVGRYEIVSDLAAVAIGWIALAAAICAIGWAAGEAMIGTAHAAAVAVTGSADLAHTLLTTVFPFLGRGGGGAVLTQGLGQIAKALSIMAFTLAGISVLWMSVFALAEYTGNYDSARTRYSPIMFAFRIVISMGLLAPIGGGWSGGQRLVGWAMDWGSTKASAAWADAVSYLSDGKNWIVKPTISDIDVVAVIQHTVAAETCMAAINLDASRSTERVVYQNGRYDYLVISNGLIASTLKIASAGGCGSVNYPDSIGSGVGSSMAGQIRGVHSTAFEQTRQAIRAIIVPYVQNRINCRDYPDNCQSDLDISANLAKLPEQYHNAIQTGIEQVWQTANQHAATQLANAAQDGGWVGAGTWAQQLAQMQASIDGAGERLPSVNPPALNSAPPQTSTGGQVAPTLAPDIVSAALAELQNGLIIIKSPTIAVPVVPKSRFEAAIDEFFKKLSFPSLYEKLAEIDSVQPLAGLSSLGKWTYGTGMTLKGTAWLSNVLPGGGGSVGESVRGIADVVAWPLIIVGFAAAYLIPMLPFIRFFFAILGWAVAVFEAVILLPILLVMIVSFEPGGVFGPARSGLWTIAATIVRPILTVAGFIFGLALMSSGIQLLNKLMIPAIRNSMDGGSVYIAFIGGLLTYLGIAYVVINFCSKMSEAVPTAAYRWAGANAGGERDDAGAVSAAIGGVVTRLGLVGGRRK